jgi:hypothetical protein
MEPSQDIFIIMSGWRWDQQAKQGDGGMAENV